MSTKDRFFKLRRYLFPYGIFNNTALGEIRFLKVHTYDNLADPFTKALSKGKLTQHARSMGLRLASSFMFTPQREVEISYLELVKGATPIAGRPVSFNAYRDEAVARHRVHVSSIPDKDGMYIEVLKRDVEVVMNTSRYELLVASIDALVRTGIGESKMIGLELEQETTKVVMISKKRLRKAKIVKSVKVDSRNGRMLGFSVGYFEECPRGTGGWLMLLDGSLLLVSCYVAIRTLVWVSKVISKRPHHVYRLKKALYGLKQAPRAWYDTLSRFLLAQGFSKGVVDPTLFIRKTGKHTLHVQIYVHARSMGLRLASSFM
ncbi:retrovirus-related pol polyprotein from transposon TNT 1-94 [Tanacetum coccineum]